MLTYRIAFFPRCSRCTREMITNKSARHANEKAEWKDHLCKMPCIVQYSRKWWPRMLVRVISRSERWIASRLHRSSIMRTGNNNRTFDNTGNISSNDERDSAIRTIATIMSSCFLRPTVERREIIYFGQEDVTTAVDLFLPSLSRTQRAKCISNISWHRERPRRWYVHYCCKPFQGSLWESCFRSGNERHCPRSCRANEGIESEAKYTSEIHPGRGR